MDMQTILYEAHSGWRYLVLLVAGLAILKALIGWLTKGKWGPLDHWLGLLTPILLDIQVLLGLILYVMRSQWAIPNPTASYEHPVTMIIVLVIAHITWSRVKRATVDQDKFRTMAIGYLIAGLILALGVARITYVL